MYRASSIVPQTEEVKITVPKEFIGKSVEIVVYASKRRRVKRFSTADLLEYYSKYNFNTNKLRLSREEANENTI